MKSVISEQVHSAWHHTLCAGVSPDGTFGLSPALAQRLLTQELIELRRELGQARKLRARLIASIPGTRGDDLAIARRRLERTISAESRLCRQIRLLMSALQRLVTRGVFMPAPKPQPATVRSRSRAFDFRR